MTDSITTRTLLIDLHFEGATDPDEINDQPGTLAFIAEGIGQYLDGEPGLVELSEVRQVFPGDVVHWDAVPDIFDLDLRQAFREVKHLGSNALSALADEHEGDVKKNVAALLDLATKIARFTGAM